MGISYEKTDEINERVRLFFEEEFEFGCDYSTEVRIEQGEDFWIQIKFIFEDCDLDYPILLNYSTTNDEFRLDARCTYEGGKPTNLLELPNELAYMVASGEIARNLGKIKKFLMELDRKEIVEISRLNKEYVKEIDLELGLR